MPQFTPFIGTAIALAVGIATYRLLPGNEIPFIGLGITAISTMLMVKLLKLCRKLKRPIQLLGNLCWSLAFGYLLMYANWPPNQEEHYLQLNLEGSPQPMLIEVIRRERSSEHYHKYTGRVLQIGDRICRGEVLLRSRRTHVRQWEAGDRLELVGSLKRPLPALNPGQFDYRAYLEDQGLFHLLDLHRSTIVHYSSPGRNWRKKMDGLKEQLHRRLGRTNLKQEHKAILNGMLLGDRGDIDPELLRSYSRAGVMHLLAISGLHIGLLYLALGWLLRPIWMLPNGYRICPVLIAGLLWSYAFFTGLSPSVVRATTVFSLFSLSKTFYRYPQSLNVLALAFYLLLIVKPLWLFQAGFQMSFLAVLGILLIHPLLSKTIRPASSWLRYLRDMLSVSLAAQIGVLPVSLYYFHQFPLAFLLANLLAIPLMTPLLITGLLLLYYVSLGDPPDSIISIFGWLVELLNAWVRFLSGRENWVLTDIPFSQFSVVLAYLLIALWYFVFSIPKRGRISLGCWLSIPLGVMLLVDHYRVPNKELAVLNSYGSSIVVANDGDQLVLWTDQPVNDQRLLGDLRRKYCASKTKSEPLPALIEVGETLMLTIDSLGIYPKVPETEVLLLSGNPRIHLGLILGELCPAQVVADGSNYPYLADRWEQTCREMGVPYHNTARQGAYITYP